MTKIEINETELNKILKNVESEINKNMILNNKLRKDSEQFLKIVLQKRNNDDKDILEFKIDDFNDICNIYYNIGDILEDLINNNCINKSSYKTINGKIKIMLTENGIHYFDNIN